MAAGRLLVNCLVVLSPVTLSQKSATVRKLRDNGDNRTFLRQCGQAFNGVDPLAVNPEIDPVLTLLSWL